MKNSIWWRFFVHRAALCYFLLILLFFTGFLRVAVIARDDYTEALKSHGRLKLQITSLRGTVYDRNMLPFTNTKSKIIACVTPTNRAKTAISTVLEGEELEDLLNRLNKGKPVLCEVPRIIDCDEIYCTTVYYDDTSVLAPHTIGYVNNDNRGVNGIQAAFNELLYSSKTANFTFSCDGLGNILEGIAPEINNDTSVVANGVVTTLDYNIQTIIEETANPLNRGAIVVAEADTLKIRGMVSRPDFDITNISEYLNDPASPLFNRAINCYAVGSCFKPCIAAAAIEKGIKNTRYNCVGNMKIIDRSFNCHNRLGHGSLNLEYALANSCNTYFFNLALKTGADGVFKMADVLHFGRKIKLCNGIYTADGTIPTLLKLQNDAHLANFSIGQGDFTASPVSMLTLYSAIANGGKYYMPSIIEGTYESGSLKKYDIGYPTKAMDSKTADSIKNYLKTVIAEGTGSAAQPKTVTAAGKTATAQTGKFENGKEILSSWFCGFFPADNPKYIIIVFCENSSLQTESCAEIFAKTADRIMGIDK
ncbi:MAG: penicillin-binding protein 2 [Clostridia bacterium]|nr:penicillin-binding protein 2 [Clostridia bacterium]